MYVDVWISEATYRQLTSALGKYRGGVHTLLHGVFSLMLGRLVLTLEVLHSLYEELYARLGQSVVERGTEAPYGAVSLDA